MWQWSFESVPEISLPTCIQFGPVSDDRWKYTSSMQHDSEFIYLQCICNVDSWFYNIHTFIQSQYIHPSPFAEASSISSSLVCSVGKTSLWCRAENRTRACLTASRRAANWATPHHHFVYYDDDGEFVYHAHISFVVFTPPPRFRRLMLVFSCHTERRNTKTQEKERGSIPAVILNREDEPILQFIAKAT